MRFTYFKAQLKDFIVFTLNDIRKVEPEFHRRRLNEWQDKGLIKKIRRDHYMFSDTPLNEQALFLVANHLYPPSYVSFEAALSFYGLIPEGVYSITSASSRKTAHFRTSIADFQYHRIKPSLFFGYRLDSYQGQWYKMAVMEKAVLDYLYLNPGIADEADFHEWRFNSRDFLAKADLTKLRRYATAFGSKLLSTRLEKMLALMIKTG